MTGERGRGAGTMEVTAAITCVETVGWGTRPTSTGRETAPASWGRWGAGPLGAKPYPKQNGHAKLCNANAALSLAALIALTKANVGLTLRLSFFCIAITSLYIMYYGVYFCAKYSRLRYTLLSNFDFCANSNKINNHVRRTRKTASKRSFRYRARRCNDAAYVQLHSHAHIDIYIF